MVGHGFRNCIRRSTGKRISVEEGGGKERRRKAEEGGGVELTFAGASRIKDRRANGLPSWVVGCQYLARER